MGFWATLTDDRGHEEWCQNYTHNCNGMANAVLPDDEFPETWWKHLDGMTGAEGGAFLARIITALEADPTRFRAMGPNNGWGDYDSFVGLLREMHRASLVEWPTEWSVNG